jgi:hypothetical protein
MTTHDFKLSRNTFGRLVFTGANGEVHEGVVPVRAFPIGAPDDGISLVSADGQELAWISRLTALPDATRAMVEKELASREFMPEIRRIQRGNQSRRCFFYAERRRGYSPYRGDQLIDRRQPRRAVFDTRYASAG